MVKFRPALTEIREPFSRSVAPEGTHTFSGRPEASLSRSRARSSGADCTTSKPGATGGAGGISGKGGGDGAS
eukprot:2505675-Prymnesium_polylepis.1